MRIKLLLTPNIPIVPFSYQHHITGAFHRWLGENQLHDGTSLYSLGWLGDWFYRQTAVPVRHLVRSSHISKYGLGWPRLARGSTSRHRRVPPADIWLAYFSRDVLVPLILAESGNLWSLPAILGNFPSSFSPALQVFNIFRAPYS
jgi:hypothetical protein